jgi:IPT/TIG domain
MLLVRSHPTLASFALVSLLALSGCGDNPTQPGGFTLTISSVTPNTGSTTGGTAITVIGSNFVPGLTVTLGGVAASNVTVTGATSLTATTASRAAGIADVVVSTSGRSATLQGAFTFVAPVAVTNTPPIIVSVSARGIRANEPAQFADPGEPIDIVANVQDAETPVSQLAYEWTSNAGGTFSGNGNAVKWRAPQPSIIPLNATLTVAVVERYDTVDASGLPVTRENRVSKSIAVSVHDSLKEVGDMARQFLLDFSDSSIRDVSYIMRNFTDLCANSKAAEASEVAHNRQHFRIMSSRVDPPAVSVEFGGRCPFRAVSGDACALVPVDWVSTFLDDGSSHHALGTDQVSAVYDGTLNRWGLCASDFDGKEVVSGLMRGFIR